MIPPVSARLYLVDGMSHIYRAFYAIQGLTDRSGRPTNAVYGFTNMLRKLIAEEKPEYLGVAIDLPGPTIRHEQFKEYKATRRPTPPDLLEQVPLALKVCEVLRIPVLSLAGYEADDVIGTLAAKAVKAGLDVVIVTIDKDMFQLVNERVSVLDPRDMTFLGPPQVESKFGVAPGQLIDVLSLVGDSSDNVPGAPGIGMKGAQKLIQQFGGLDELLLERDQVSHKTYRKSLEENEEQIRQSRELVTIHQDLPVDLDLDDLRLEDPNRDEARRLFSELNFLSLLDEFISPGPESSADYSPLPDLEAVHSVAADLGGKTVALAPHLETQAESLHLSGLAFSCSRWTGHFLPPELLENHSVEIFRVLLTAGSWVGHDLKPLLAYLDGMGIEPDVELCDTMLMAYLLAPNQKDLSLQKSCLEYLQYRFSETEGKDQKSLFADPAMRELAERADLTGQLAETLEPMVEPAGLQTVLEKIEMPLIRVLVEMEKRGVLVDTELLESMSEQAGQEIDRLSDAIYELAGEEFNLNSPSQLADILFDKLGLPIVKKTRKAGHYATGVEVLEKLAGEYEIAQRILEYRELSKLKSTYLDALPRLVNSRSGRIHTSFNQMTTATGRLSSSNPNLQNIPIRSEMGREIRKAFHAPEGYCILSADYSQIELRVMAHLSSDPVLVDAFRRGEDIHYRTALEVFGEEAEQDPAYRRRAKVINFGIMYGLSPFGLAETLGIERKEAQHFIDQYFNRYQGVRNWIDNTLQQARESGCVTTLFGRIRPVPEINSRNWNVRHFGERTAINAPIQGTAADLIKLAMIDIDRKLRVQELKSSLILQVHDELVLEVAESEIEIVKPLVREAMASVASLDVELGVDMGLGDSWYAAK